jgi:predicted ATPase
MHFEHGQDYQRAVQYLWQATETAMQRCAHREAVAHLMHMRELLRRLPPTSERTQQELALLTILGAQLTVTKGYGAPEVEKTYAEAWELCKQVEEDFRLFPILAGLSRFYVMRAELEPARTLAEQLLHLAHTLQDPTLLMAGHCQLGGVLFWRGEFAAAQNHLEQSSALYDSQLHQALTSLYAEDPGVVCRVFLAFNLWLRGYPDRAVEHMSRILQLTRDMGDLYGQTFALFFTASLHQYRKDWQSAQDYASAIMTLARAEGFLLWEAGATAMQGWAFSEQGRQEEGIVLLRQGLSGWRATGARVGQPYIHGLLAEALGQAGRPHEGLAVLEEQFGVQLNVGPCECAAELHRVKGELLLRAARSVQRATGEQPELHFNQHAAESCFDTAITIARRQGAKSWELRAMISLCRLWQQQGKIAEARQALTDVYNWFTEGFGTGDLKEAKVLLDALT